MLIVKSCSSLRRSQLEDLGNDMLCFLFSFLIVFIHCQSISAIEMDLGVASCDSNRQLDRFVYRREFVGCNLSADVMS